MAHSWPKVASLATCLVEGELARLTAPGGPAPCCCGPGRVASPIFSITSCRAGSRKSWTEGVG